MLTAVFAESQPVPRSATANLPSTCGPFSGMARASQGKAAVTKAQVRSLVLTAPGLPVPFYRVEILIPALKGCGEDESLAHVVPAHRRHSKVGNERAAEEGEDGRREDGRRAQG